MWFQSQHAENNEKRRRTNIMILSITVVFFVSWLPLNVFNFLMDMYPEKMKTAIAGNETVIYAVLHLFGMCNALTNPILYVNKFSLKTVFSDLQINWRFIILFLRCNAMVRAVYMLFV